MGGKLPGLVGGRANTGGKKSSGDGWSARYMWREQGKLCLYLYHPKQPDRYGEYFCTDVKFETDRWYWLHQQVTINSPGNSDGSIIVRVDGKQVLNLRNMVLRYGNAAPIDAFYFSTFFGGNQPEWAPQRDSYANFKGIRFARLRP